MTQPILYRWDGHTHTQYCDHGTREATTLLIERAIALGFKRYSLTEHPPFPCNFQDPSPEKDAAIQAASLQPYLEHARELKERYKDRIRIDVGMEFDYIHLPEVREECLAFHERFSPELDWEGTILSVHLIDGQFVDYTVAALKEKLLPRYGGGPETAREHGLFADALHIRYCELLEEAMSAPWKPRHPHRVGHLTLPRKFIKLFPYRDEAAVKRRFIRVLDCVKDLGYALDANCAGEFKKDCGERYLPDWILPEVFRREIPIVYGSDSHGLEDVGRGFDRLVETVLKINPNFTIE